MRSIPHLVCNGIPTELRIGPKMTPVSIRIYVQDRSSPCCKRLGMFQPFNFMAFKRLSERVVTAPSTTSALKTVRKVQAMFGSLMETLADVVRPK